MTVTALPETACFAVDGLKENSFYDIMPIKSVCKYVTWQGDGRNETGGAKKKNWLTVVAVVVVIAAARTVVVPLLLSQEDEADDGLTAETLSEDGTAVMIDSASVNEMASYFDNDVDGVTVKLFALETSDGSIRLALNTCQVCNESPYVYFAQSGEVFISRTAETVLPPPRWASSAAAAARFPSPRNTT